MKISFYLIIAIPEPILLKMFLGAKMMKMFGWEFTEDQLNAFKQMWIATDIDGDYGSRSMMEQINFLLKQWAYFIQN